MRSTLVFAATAAWASGLAAACGVAPSPEPTVRVAPTATPQPSEAPQHRDLASTTSAAPSPFSLVPCSGLVGKLPRGVNARTHDGAVSFFIERLPRDDDASARPGPSMRATVASFDESGAQHWKRDLGTLDTHSSPAWPLAVTPAGDIVLAGAFEGVMSVGQPPLSTSAPSWSQPRPYVVRLDERGSVTLARMLTEFRDGPVRGLALASNGDAVVGIERTREKPGDPYESTVVRLDEAGQPVWSRQFAGLVGPVQLTDSTVALLDHRPDDTQKGAQWALVVLDTETGKTKKRRAWPLRAHEQSLAGTADGRVHALLYAHDPLPELGLGDRDGLSMSLVSFDADLKHVTTGLMELHNGKMLASDRHGRAVVTHMGRFDHGLSFVEGHGADRTDDSGGHYPMAFLPVAALGDGAHPGQGLELCLDCTSPCQEEGQCAVEYGECVVTSDADCRTSEACTKHGRCAKGETGCVAVDAAHCEASGDCKATGACALVNGVCFGPSTDAHCSGSDACKKWGLCSKGPNGCGPSEAAHCRASQACGASGRCNLATSFGAGMCIASSGADCLRSRRCREYGECSRHPDPLTPVCVIRSDADCRRSKACQDEGACSYARAFLGDSAWAEFCEAQSDADCRRSKACIAEGRCRLVRRQCVK